MRLHKIIFCGLFFYGKILVAQHPNAHAHNDYKHKRPLFDALDNDFTSIEADVFLHEGKLKVSHTAVNLNHKPDLETLYLHPLDSIVKEQDGWIYPNWHTSVILMIDFKTSGNKAYVVLKELLNKYKHLLTVYNKSTIIKRAPIQILISGNTPDVSLLGETSLVTLDKGFYALNDSSVLPYVTRISEPWGKYFHSRKKLSKKEKEHLKVLVAQTHQAGKQIRFWAIPDNVKIWEALLENRVDWINTDKLKKFDQSQTIIAH